MQTKDLVSFPAVMGMMRLSKRAVTCRQKIGTSSATFQCL